MCGLSKARAALDIHVKATVKKGGASNDKVGVAFFES